MRFSSAAPFRMVGDQGSTDGGKWPPSVDGGTDVRVPAVPNERHPVPNERQRRPERKAVPSRTKGNAVQDFDHVLTTTRAVRKRLDLDRPVEPAVITECLALAAQAPTGANRQDWRFVVVTDPDLRAAVAEYYRSGAADYLKAAIDAARTDQQRRVAKSSLHLMQNLARVPVLVLPCVKGLSLIHI